MTDITILKHPTPIEVAALWKRQYCAGGSWSTNIAGRSSKDIYDAIIDLGLAASPERINAVIGNDSWTRLECDSCHQDKDEVWAIAGDEYSTHVCRECVELASKQFGRR